MYKYIIYIHMCIHIYIYIPLLLLGFLSLKINILKCFKDEYFQYFYVYVKINMMLNFLKFL